MKVRSSSGISIRLSGYMTGFQPATACGSWGDSTTAWPMQAAYLV